ncbi:aminoacyl--tRNA ligase-related protein [Streptomyces sp. NPDC088923]|uniref:aminoacyl--tRNA ligase-related protein n=1 Tax=Streptomyces sp. NPDC088923 TaxID=3365913 RepID=UPI0038072DA5
MRLSFGRAVGNPAVQGTLRTQLRFHYPRITEVTFTDDTVEVVGEGLDEAELSAFVQRVTRTFAALPNVPVRVRYDSAARPAAGAWVPSHDAEAFDAAARSLAADLEEAAADRPARRTPDVGSRPAGRGLNVYGHDEASLHRVLDHFLRRYFQRAYGAQELRVPSMIPTAVVDRAGYIETARQHLSFVSPLDPAPGPFEEFLPYWRETASQGSARDAGIHAYLGIPRDVLNPALCLHCYPLLESAVVTAATPAVLTLTGSCFRDESGNLNHAERLREFAMREAVVVGTPETVDRVHGELADFMIATAELLGLDFRLESATDIFFNDGAPQLLFSQLLSDNKFELAVQDPATGQSVATASLNKHQTHFTEPFGMKTEDGRPAVSLCVGFGIDRLALALVRGAAGRQAPVLESLRDAVVEHLATRSGPGGTR